MQTITTHWVNGAKSLGFDLSSTTKKIANVKKQFDVDIVRPACNFIKNKTPKALSCKYYNLFQPVTLSKTRPWNRCFLVKFGKFFSLLLSQKWDSDKIDVLQILLMFSALNFAKNETPAKVFSCEFSEIFLLATAFRTRLWHRCSSVNLAKCLRALNLQNIWKRLLLMIWSLLDSFVRFIVH